MIVRSSFGFLDDGREADLYRLTNARGHELRITNFGATIVAVKIPDRHGKLGDVVLGYETLPEYVNGATYFGATVGRYANRIAGAELMLDGERYLLSRNEGAGHLHGGFAGFGKALWDVYEAPPRHDSCLELRYLSKHKEEGYPGNLAVRVAFTWNEHSELQIDYRATTDRATILNLTNHSYFNLKGCGDILAHQLTLCASHFTPVRSDLIPTGRVESVEATPFDFRRGVAIGATIDDPDEQLRIGHGFDHNWVIDRDGLGGVAHAASVYEPTTGRHLAVWTTEPGIQFYSGNYLDGTVAGKHDVRYGPRAGLCLETQHFPDSPNHPNFPTTILRPGPAYISTTLYKFSVVEGDGRAPYQQDAIQQSGDDSPLGNTVIL